MYDLTEVIYSLWDQFGDDTMSQVKIEVIDQVLDQISIKVGSDIMNYR
jgi:hypothetical protein